MIQIQPNCSNDDTDPNPAQLVLNGDSLPWVTSAKYLGNTIESIPNGLAKDTKQKRAQYIEKNCELVQEFGFAHPDVKSRLNRIYNSSFPGSLLWDLSSENVKQIVNSWSVSARIMWGLPHDAHRYLIEELSGEHAFVMIVSRYIKFIQSIKKSPKYPVQFLLEKVMNNVNTLTSRNIRFILDKVNKENIFDVKPAQLKKLKFCEVRNEDKWRVEFIREITNLKQNALCLSDDGVDFDADDLEDILKYLATS